MFFHSEAENRYIIQNGRVTHLTPVDPINLQCLKITCLGRSFIEYLHSGFTNPRLLSVEMNQCHLLNDIDSFHLKVDAGW